MAPPKIYVLGIFALVFLVGIEAQQTFQFSSFSQIPQSLLNQLGSAQIENLKQQLKPSGGGGSPSQQGGGGGSPGKQQTLQFSRFSEIPQSVLNNLPSDQVEQLKQVLQGNGGGSIQTYQIPGMPGGQQQTQQTFQFSRFSQIPQSVLDKLPSDQVEQIKMALQGNGNGGVQTYQIPGQMTMQTYQMPGQQTQQTFQFSSFSQIPQSLLDELTSSQISEIKRELTPQTVQQPQQIQQIPQKTLQYSSFSQIPQSVLDQFTSDQIDQIKMELQQGGETVQLPATVTSYSYTLPGGNNRRVNNALNVIFNYVAAGGYLTGVPPIDLLLIRFYIQMGPEKFCG